MNVGTRDAILYGMTTQEQTELTEKLRDCLTSITILAAEASNNLGNPDWVLDKLSNIESNLTMAFQFVEIKRVKV